MSLLFLQFIKEHSLEGRRRMFRDLSECVCSMTQLIRLDIISCSLRFPLFQNHSPEFLFLRASIPDLHNLSSEALWSDSLGLLIHRLSEHDRSPSNEWLRHRSSMLSYFEIHDWVPCSRSFVEIRTSGCNIRQSSLLHSRVLILALRSAMAPPSSDSHRRLLRVEWSSWDIDRCGSAWSALKHNFPWISTGIGCLNFQRLRSNLLLVNPRKHEI